MVFAQLGIRRRIQQTAKVSRSEGVLLQNQFFGTRPRNPRNPRKWCHDPLLGTSPTRAGGQDDVSYKQNPSKNVPGQIRPVGSPLLCADRPKAHQREPRIPLPLTEPKVNMHMCIGAEVERPPMDRA